MLSKNKSIALALGSGSAKGLSHIGIINTLNKLDYKIDAIAGSSIGAVVASYYAFNKLNEYEKFNLNLTKTKVFSLFDINLIPKKGLMDGDKICNFFMESLGNVNIEDANIPLFIVATDLESGKPIVFSKGNLIQAVRASISIPGIFSPAIIKGKILVDGGVSNPLPIDILKQKNYKKIFAVDLNNSLKEISFESSPNIITTFYRSFSIMNFYQTQLILSNFKPDILFTPSLSDIGMFEYHKAKEIIKRGEMAVYEKIKK